MIKKLFLALNIFYLLIAGTQAEAIDLAFSSPESRVSLIELYTSEGCSSCPPADRWLNGLKDNKLLWKKVVPVAFHVDYWDYLGWKDKFADKRFSQRQNTYQFLNYVSTVYTPGVMKNGREWRDWRAWAWQPNLSSNLKEKPGILSAKLNDKHFSVSFNTNQTPTSPYVLNIALLGNNIESQIKAGENDGEIFNHHFVVLEFQEHLNSDLNNSSSWKVSNPLLSTTHNASAIAIWISTGNDPTPIQATGSWLNN